MSRRGARPIEALLRQLLAIADALSREGSIVDTKGVSYLLGISCEEAAEAIGDVMEAATGADASTGVVLPLEGDAERGIRLMKGFEPIRALRMTRPEALAMVEALDAIGVDDDALGGIRGKIAKALFPMDMDAKTGDDSRAGHDGSELPAQLIACLDALYCNHGLTFVYEGERGVSTERRVEPLSLTYLFGQWVLDALDLEVETGREGCVSRETLEVEGGAEADDEVLNRRRFFLARRLRAIQPMTLPSTHAEFRNLPWDIGGEWVRLYFTDRSLYDAGPDWTWSREVPRNRLRADEKRRIGTDGCAVDVRYFPGSPYVARLVVACAGSCTTDDPALLGDIREYLATLP